MRWISLILSIIALGFACYSAWYAKYVNKILARKNVNLLGENARLTEKIMDYEGEILRLVNQLKQKESLDFPRKLS